MAATRSTSGSVCTWHWGTVPHEVGLNSSAYLSLLPTLRISGILHPIRSKLLILLKVPVDARSITLHLEQKIKFHLVRVITQRQGAKSFFKASSTSPCWCQQYITLYLEQMIRFHFIRMMTERRAAISFLKANSWQQENLHLVNSDGTMEGSKVLLESQSIFAT
jgi:hypothetical protein